MMIQQHDEIVGGNSQTLIEKKEPLKKDIQGDYTSHICV